MKRYTVAIDLYIWADSDADVIEKAQAIAKELQAKEDNNAKVLDIYETPFGIFESRAVKIESEVK